MTKAGLLGSVSSEELTEWQALWMVRAAEREQAKR